MEIFFVAPLTPVLVFLVFVIILCVLGVVGLSGIVISFLNQYFVQILVTFFGLIILICIVIIVFVWVTDIRIYDKFFFSVNLLVSSIISFPVFYMFFLEFCCSYGMAGMIPEILALIESVIGIVIAAIILVLYLVFCMALDIGIFVWGDESEFKYIGVVKITLYMVLTAANIFIVYHFYRLCLHLLVKYYINEEALEIYKNMISPTIYNFMCFCQNMYEKIY